MRLDRIDKAGAVTGATEAQATRKTGATAFEDALRQAAGSESTTAAPSLDFSKHALQRLEQRGIKLDDQLMERLTGAVDRAATKGSRTTLVLVDQTAFVVGVPNRTVVTVADQENLREKVFTNIDSMVIA